MNEPKSAPDTGNLTVENPSGPGGRTGVLLVNLGTPDATDYWSMRRYLKEFLSDPRVIETNRVVWWFVLNFIVLTTRPQAKGRDYDKIWNRERNESPLKTITRAQAEKLAAHFAGIDSRVLVEWAMRYGNPSLESRLKGLVAAGCEKILILPLYPQYAAATTATVCDKAFEALAKMRWQPAVRVAPPYYDDPVYIDALADSIEQDLAKLAWKPDVILASFHGIPVDYVLAGDPYESRFGRTEWIKPYTDETVRALAKEGVKNLAVVTPGFAADCLETLEEIAGENAEIFHHNGGKNFRAIPCLNDSDGGMQVIRNVVERELKGWV
jgi:ferrochelatase